MEIPDYVHIAGEMVISTFESIPVILFKSIIFRELLVSTPVIPRFVDLPTVTGIYRWTGHYVQYRHVADGFFAGQWQPLTDAELLALSANRPDKAPLKVF